MPPCFSLVVPRSCSNEHGELEVRDDVMGGSHANIGVGKKAQPLLSVDVDVPCSYMKQNTGEGVVVENAVEGGDVLCGDERDIAGEGRMCLVETGFKSDFDGLGFGSQFMGC